MSRPTTLRERIDQLGDELTSDPKLFSGVLDNLITKKAAAETPKRVTDMAATIEKSLGVTKEAAVKMAWQTYVKYVNPSAEMPEAMRDKVAVTTTPTTIETKFSNEKVAAADDLGVQLAALDEADTDVEDLKKGLGL